MNTLMKSANKCWCGSKYNAEYDVTDEDLCDIHINWIKEHTRHGILSDSQKDEE